MRDRQAAATTASVCEPPGMRGIDVALIITIFACAFALRLIYVQQLRASPLFEDPVMDELYHDQWARSIVAGETYVEGPYFRAPLYPAFLAAVYRVFGPGYLVPRLVQAFLGSLSCVLLFLIGRQIFGRGIAAIAGFLAASYWMLIYFDGELLIPSLIVFLDLLLVWLLLRIAGGGGLLGLGGFFGHACSFRFSRTAILAVFL